MKRFIRSSIIKKAERTSLTNEDKQVYIETQKIMEDCVSILESYIIQSKDYIDDLDKLIMDDFDRTNRKKDLNTLKQIFEQLKNLFEV